MVDDKVLAVIDIVFSILKRNGIQISQNVRHECIMVAYNDIDVNRFLNRIIQEYNESK